MIEMKLIQVHNNYRFGNGENIMFEGISRILRQKGHKVFIFKRKSDNIKGQWEKICAFREGIYSNSSKKELSCILAKEHPDVVHVHNVYPLISPSVPVACRDFSIPVVMSCHNYRLICPTGLFFDGSDVCERCKDGREYWCVLKNCRGNVLESMAYASRNAIARKLRLFLDNVTLYVPPSEFVKRKLIDAGFPGERIVVIPNMVTLPDSVVDASAGKYVAYAGNIRPEKGINTLLAAARKTRLQIRLAGDYSPMPEVVKVAQANEKFVGHLNRGQLSNFYRNARFLVVPSVCFEAFGLVVVEAMSHGLPVIASRIGGMPEIVEDGVTGFLFEPGNSEDLANKMNLLWENPDLCRQMGIQGHEKVISEYSNEVYYRRLMAVYEKAIILKGEENNHLKHPVFRS
jgi:glycosyltransferase involved in cell wall biosynthesis